MMTRRTMALWLAGALLAPSIAAAVPPVFSADGLAIRGADPVAYFTDGKHVAGRPEFTHAWMGATWQFASAAHRDTFAANPDKYAPQYGGYCAYAVSQGRTATIDPDAFTVVGDKLYLNYSKDIEKKWRADRDAYITQADRNWPGIRDDK